MSSVNWQKIRTASEAKAKIRHNEKDIRKQTNHSNIDINKDLTSLNLSLDGLNYKQRCERYDRRVAECKSNMTRVRSDAITMISLNIKLPGGLTGAPYEKQKEWCEDCYKIVKAFVGADNVVSATADFDEIHKYYNPDTHRQELSRAEVDVRFVPEMNGKLCAKAWQTKGNMRLLNERIDEMTSVKYNMPFLTGEQSKNVSTEVLKTRSAKYEAELCLEAINALRDELEADREAFEQEKREYALEREKELKMQNTLFERKSKMMTIRENDVSKREKLQLAREKEFQAKEDALEAQERMLKKKEMELSRREQAVGLAEKVSNSGKSDTQSKRMGIPGF